MQAHCINEKVESLIVNNLNPAFKNRSTQISRNLYVYYRAQGLHPNNISVPWSISVPWVQPQQVPATSHFSSG